jgi:flap endonuclease-1
VKEKAEAELAEAETRMEHAAAGTEEHNTAVEDINKAQRRMVKVTKEQNEDAKKLLRLMGIPVVEAPCEAEAQCAELCKGGKVWATGTEDMDALAFATPILLRKLTSPETKKEPVIEIHVEKVLGPDGLQLTMDQFIDLCILCGCDYCDSIRGVGSKTALKLIREHGSIENILKTIDRQKYPVPETLETRLDEIRALFKHPDVTPAADVDFSFGAPKEAELLEFLVRDKGFNEDRVKKVIERLHKARQGGAQMRLDNFFKPASATGADQAFKHKQSVKSGKGAAAAAKKGAKTGAKDDGGSSKKKQKSG